MPAEKNLLRISFAAMSTNLHVRRLFREDKGVEGCGFFHKRPERTFHVLGNVLRLIYCLVFAPVYLLTPRWLGESFNNYVQTNWLVEYATTPDSVLSNAKGGGRGRYDVAGFRPSWVLEVTIRDGALQSYRQVSIGEDMPAPPDYTALSYPMSSAAVLADEAGFVRTQPPPQRAYTLPDRRKIAEYFLRLYCSSPRIPRDTENGDPNPDRVEYIWLDEFCLSDDAVLGQDATVDAQRSKELGRLPDIFRGAAQTVVFCDKVGCDHTRLTCEWGQRLFTIPEILHAQTVWSLTRWSEPGSMMAAGARLSKMSGAKFRETMQKYAALGNKWHLYAIFQHTVNAGAVPWQVAIHALVVEAIRRDEAGGFDKHEFLGKALNGLLPRRARLEDLGGGGWRDLAWLLELNQGFYNAASLAAVCSVADPKKDAEKAESVQELEKVLWLGKPIEPSAGNERLEPIVTAFPVSSGIDTAPALAIIDGETLGFRRNRSSATRRGCGGNRFAGVALFYVTSILYCIVELLAGTMYLERQGWVFLKDSEWDDKKLGEQDSNLRDLTYWGEQQMVPHWEAPLHRSSFQGKLVDLRSRVCAEACVTDQPNALIPLAVHGSGVTCMLVTRPEDSAEEPTVFANKVGMVNVPPYILAQTVRSGTLYIANSRSKTGNDDSKAQ